MMEIKLKGLYGRSEKIPDNKRGCSYDIGKIKAGVTLTDDGLILLITNHKLMEGLKKLLRDI